MRRRSHKLQKAFVLPRYRQSCCGTRPLVGLPSYLQARTCVQSPHHTLAQIETSPIAGSYAVIAELVFPAVACGLAYTSGKESRRLTHRYSCRLIGSTTEGGALLGHASSLVGLSIPITHRRRSERQRAVIGCRFEFGLRTASDEQASSQCHGFIG